MNLGPYPDKERILSYKFCPSDSSFTRPLGPSESVEERG